MPPFMFMVRQRAWTVGLDAEAAAEQDRIDPVHHGQQGFPGQCGFPFLGLCAPAASMRPVARKLEREGGGWRPPDSVAGDVSNAEIGAFAFRINESRVLRSS